MGYFSNGTEGMDYIDQYCERCVHWQNGALCPVWGLHLLYNYRDCNDPKSMLHVLIPRSDRVADDGLPVGGNERCKMFYEIPRPKLRAVKGGKV